MLRSFRALFKDAGFTRETREREISIVTLLTDMKREEGFASEANVGIEGGYSTEFVLRVS